MQSIVTVALSEGKLSWLALGAAGGSELPPCDEPFRLRVGLPIALGKALGLSPRETALFGARAASSSEDFEGALRWLRWSLELPEGSFAALGLRSAQGGQAVADALGAAAGVPLFPDFEIPGAARAGAFGTLEFASAGRDPDDLLRLYAILEGKAIDAISQASRSRPTSPRL